MDLLLPLPTLAAAALTLLLAFTIFGLTGFGSNIVALPLLAQLLPLRCVVPLILLLDLCASLLMGVKHIREVERGELKRLLPVAAIGMVLGVTVLVQAPERWLLLLLGVFVLANSAWALLSRVPPAPISTRWALPAGAFGGVFSALYGTGGPLYAAYLARRVHDKHRLRATLGRHHLPQRHHAAGAVRRQRALRSARAAGRRCADAAFRAGRAGAGQPAARAPAGGTRRPGCLGAADRRRHRPGGARAGCAMTVARDE